ncbi:MAG: protein kinase [Gemmatimonadota bacterium]
MNERLTAALADRYRIERELGQGGMATVYLAEDLKHHRKVAVKVLKPELAAVLGAERFLQEITTTAALQHPHILPLFDSGQAVVPPLREGERGPGGEVFLYYVMPFIDGETLRSKLDRETQLGIDESVRIATQVADALDYAHRNGVIHRDIKPENILLHDGRPMVADFGIALAVSAAAGGRMTETGLSLGTPHYMSPEQATAEKEITARSDVYSLGSVLYEMLTGNPPHTGASAQQIIMKIVTEEAAPVTKARKSVPPNVAAAVAKSLEKLPADRFATAKEFADALTNAGYTRPMTGVGFGASAGGGRWKQVALAAGAAAVACAALALWAWRRPESPRPMMRFGLAFPDSQVPQGGIHLSQDGTRFLYEGPGANGGTQLWVKERNRYEATPLAGTTAPQGFTTSPDGQWIAFVQNAQLKKMPIGGGTPIALADSVFFSGVAWLDDGTLIYTSLSFALMRISAAGDSTTVLQKPEAMPGRIPALVTPLPGARGVLFTACNANCGFADLWVFDLRSDSARQLVPGVLQGWYLPTGHLAFVGPDGEMLAVPFDLKSLKINGTPVPVLSGVALLVGIVPNVTVSSSGTVIMQSGRAIGGPRGIVDLVWVDRSGRRQPVDSNWIFRLSQSGGNNGWALSPDGTRLVIGLNTNSGDDIWIKQLPAGPLSRLTFDTAAEQRPHWTPDGRSVTYLYNATTLHQRRADGTGADETLLSKPTPIIEGFWSRDGTWLIARTGGRGGQTGGRDIIGLRPGVDSAARPLVANPGFDEAAPTLSPDGKWLAYESNETGRMEVYIRPFPNTEGGKWQVSTDGGQAPLWAHGGREIFFVDGNRNMVVTPVAGGMSPGLGERRVLFRMGVDLYLGEPENYTPFDISPDDKRFIMVRQAATAPEKPTFILVENWFEELKARMGAH